MLTDDHPEPGTAGAAEDSREAGRARGAAGRTIGIKGGGMAGRETER